ncbi:DUF5342 family protein [Salisediminibacterium halotolerans]|uniref:Uncharacterized protein n=1 Tax=Salisediminibacterium halotolerans TaxID=517425 RepID=A0A1H9THS0_9BACI|nr:DUF5342 family protein [Salisediminibacterium haloalkalitolerans]SER96735.1 hypothetical protein SAMN05444126_11029 [Salisediminibacterium haloalkalitolerans]
MLEHFQLKELKNNLVNQEWEFTFYYKKRRFRGRYYKNGEIRWLYREPADNEEAEFLHSAVHDLMLYHVYEER